MTIPAKKNMQELDLDKMKNRFRRVLHGRSITVYSVKREMLTLRYFLTITHTVSEYIYEYQYAVVHLRTLLTSHREDVCPAHLWVMKNLLLI